MKKYLLFLFVLVFGLSLFSINFTSAYDSGCKTGDLFSRITGRSCVSASSTDCAPGDLFSSVTGKSCSTNSSQNSSSQSPTSGNSNTFRRITPPILGTTGNNISEIQRTLNRAGFSLRVDGRYGRATRAALEQYNRMYSPSSTNSTALSVGDEYGGGVVGYILKEGDAGYDANTQKGLIVAKEDQSSGAVWGCVGVSTGASGTVIGTGKDNTDKIIANCNEADIAAKIARAYKGGENFDWYLPSKDELNQLYLNKDSIFKDSNGAFANDYYWSSSEVSALTAWRQSFDNNLQGLQVFNGARNAILRHVRAVRSFTVTTTPPANTCAVQPQPTDQGTCVNGCFVQVGGVSGGETWQCVPNGTPPPASTPTITVLSPNGGENLTLTSTTPIRWKMTGKLLSYVSVYLQPEGSSTVYSIAGDPFRTADSFRLVSSGADMYGFDWYVGDVNGISNKIGKYKILVQNHSGTEGSPDVEDYSDAFFTISAAVATAPACTLSISYNPIVVPFGGSLTVSYTGTNIDFSKGSVQYNFDNKGYFPVSPFPDSKVQANLTSIGNHTIVLKAQNSAGITCMSNSAGYIVSPPSSSSTTVTLPKAKVGQNYTANIEVTDLTGMNSNVSSWTVSLPSLPAGLGRGTCVGNCVSITGKPLIANTYNFSLILTNGFQTLKKDFVIIVDLADVVSTPAVSITTPATLPNATVGQSYSLNLVATGGTGTFVWSTGLGAFPVSGLSLIGTSITGTPTASGIYPFNLTVTSGSQSLTKQFTLTVGESCSGQGPSGCGGGTIVPAVAPVIDYISPTFGLAGSAFTINGSNFGASGTIVFENSSVIMTAPYKNSNGTFTSYLIPAGATAGDYTVYLNDSNNNSSNTKTFTVNAPAGQSTPPPSTGNTCPYSPPTSYLPYLPSCANGCYYPIGGPSGGDPWDYWECRTVQGAETFNFISLLKRGSFGNEVLELQKRLLVLEYYKEVLDGKFGASTEAAVMKFQTANKLSKVDGIVGPETRALLNK